MGHLVNVLSAAVAAGVGTAVASGIQKASASAVEGGGSGLVNAVGALKNAWANGAGQSLVTKSKALRVEPIVLIDDRCARLPYAKVLLQTAQRLFTPYYLLSVAADNSVGNVKISQRLDKFSPDRDLHSASVKFLSMESFEHGLPFSDGLIGLDRYSSYSTEAHIPNRPHSPAAKVTTANAGSDPAKIANDIQNLAVGVIANVEIVDGNNRATIPVQFRMRPMGTSTVAMSEIIALGGEDTSRAARYKKWKMGEIDLWKDGVLNQDRITRYRQATMTDKSGYFRKVHARANRGKIATILTGQPSIGVASSIAIMDVSTRRSAEEKMNGSLDHFETRQAIFEAGLMMMIFVVDDDNEVVTVYTRDIDDSVTYPVADLESSKTSNDAADLLKMLMEGRMPGRL